MNVINSFDCENSAKTPGNGICTWRNDGNDINGNPKLQFNVLAMVCFISEEINNFMRETQATRSADDCAIGISVLSWVGLKVVGGWHFHLVRVPHPDADVEPVALGRWFHQRRTRELVPGSQLRRLGVHTRLLV